MSLAQTELLTPTVRTWWRRSRYWFGAGALVLVIAVISLALGGTGGGGEALDPRNPAPRGAKALAEVLRTQGVDVVVTDQYLGVVDALDDPTPTTLLIDDWQGILGEPSLKELTGLGAERLVLLDPTQAALDVALPGVRRSGVTSEPSEAIECALVLTRGLGEITGRSTLFDLGDASGVAGCYPTPGGLVRIAATGRTVAFGPLDALSNERITESANAALALRVLGAEPRLIWYRPGLSEADVTVAPTMADLSPGWVVPVMLLLVATFFAAVLWRGRRLGPLVVESLPSIVPADETVRGRGRMYARARARLRAADALRIGALGRLAVRLGQPASASIDELASAAAAVTGRRAETLRALLRDDDPRDDAALLRLATELTRLEQDVARATRPPIGA
ncbi:MAG TPA: DUF4350 domain-containing protein [Microbacteriaceae bacterium]|nr:DUF4350 domain-containing protein [Microbacteriaceae bacterium]